MESEQAQLFLGSGPGFRPRASKLNSVRATTEPGRRRGSKLNSASGVGPDSGLDEKFRLFLGDNRSGSEGERASSTLFGERARMLVESEQTTERAPKETEQAKLCLERGPRFRPKSSKLNSVWTAKRAPRESAQAQFFLWERGPGSS